jgi:hypothetical protein
VHGNVDDPLTITGDQLMVCGPVKWTGDEPGDTPASSVEVRSVKVVRVDPLSGELGPQVGAFNHATPFPSGVDDWMVTVRITSDDPLLPGDTVRVTVQAVVRLAGGGVRTEPWDHQVTITDVPEGDGTPEPPAE